MGDRGKPSTIPSTEHEPLTGLLAREYALSLLTLKREGSTMTMLLARGVEIDTINELITAGLATAAMECHWGGPRACSEAPRPTPARANRD
jgi:hypothetical protein